MISKSDRGEITCEIWLEVVGSPPAGAVARPVSRSAPVLSDPPPLAPGCLSGRRWGFCTIRSILPACRRRVAPLLVQFPPFADGDVAVRDGEAPASQTASAKNADNGELRLGGLHRGHNGAWPRVELAREPAMWSVGGAAQAHNSVPTCE